MNGGDFSGYNRFGEEMNHAGKRRATEYRGGFEHLDETEQERIQMEN